MPATSTHDRAAALHALGTNNHAILPIEMVTSVGRRQRLGYFLSLKVAR